MDNSTKFKAGLFFRIGNLMAGIASFSDKVSDGLDNDDKLFIKELVDFVEKLNSEDDFENVNDEWLINTLSRLIKTRKKYETKTGTKIKLEEMDDSSNFKATLYTILVNEMQNNPFWDAWRKNSVDVGQENESFILKVGDVLIELQEKYKTVREAMVTVEEEWLINAASRLIEIRKKYGTKTKNKTTTKKATSSEKVKYTSVVIKRKVQLLATATIEIDMDGEASTKLDSGQVKEIEVLYGKKHTLVAKIANDIERKEFLANTERINFIVQQTLLGPSIEKVDDDKIDISDGAAVWEKVLKTGSQVIVASAEANANASAHAYQCQYCGQLRYGRSKPSASASTGCLRGPYRVHLWNKVN